MDHDNNDLNVWESGSILLYLAERDPQHRLLPADPTARTHVISWLFWQMVSWTPVLGPIPSSTCWLVVAAWHGRLATGGSRLPPFRSLLQP